MEREEKEEKCFLKMRLNIYGGELEQIEINVLLESRSTDTMAKSLILCGPNSNSNPK